MKTPFLQSSYGFKLGLVVISPECEGLPSAPTANQMLWTQARSDLLPPPECMVVPHMIVRRFAINSIVKDRPSDLEQISKADGPSINIEQLAVLGLPQLPTLQSVKPPKKSKESTEKSVTSQFAKKSSSSFSAPDYYGADEAALSKLLKTTAVLIERIPTQSAADILMDMPSWMRTIFLARHGIPRVVGVLLATRIAEAGESTILSRDGIVEAHNVIAPERKVLDCKIAISREELAGSGLNRLTAPRRGSKAAVTIKNPNLNVQQNPRVIVPKKSGITNLYS